MGGVRAGAGRLDVVHLLVLGGGFVGLVDELFEGELVEDLVGGFGEFLVEEADGDFAGGHFGGDASLAEGEASFELADEVSDDDLARGAGEAVAAFAADFAFEESAAAEGEEDGLEELGGEVFVFGQVAGLDVVARAHPRQLHDGPEPVFGLLGKPQKTTPGRREMHEASGGWYGRRRLGATPGMRTGEANDE